MEPDLNLIASGGPSSVASAVPLLEMASTMSATPLHSSSMSPSSTAAVSTCELTVGESKSEELSTPALLAPSKPEISMTEAVTKRKQSISISLASIATAEAADSKVVTSATTFPIISQVTKIPSTDVFSNVSSTHHSGLTSETEVKSPGVPAVAQLALSLANLTSMTTTNPPTMTAATITSPTVLSTTVASIKMSSSQSSLDHLHRRSSMSNHISPPQSSCYRFPVRFFGPEPWDLLEPDHQEGQMQPGSTSPCDFFIPVPMLASEAQVFCWDPMMRRPHYCSHCRQLFVKEALSRRVEFTQNNMSLLYQEVHAMIDERYQSSIEVVQQLRIDTLQRIRNFIAMQTRNRSSNPNMLIGDSCITLAV